MTSENEKVHVEELGYGFFIKYDGLRDQNRWTAIGPLGRIGADVPNRDQAAALISMERTRMLDYVNWNGGECPVPDVECEVQRAGGFRSEGRLGRNYTGWQWLPGYHWNIVRFKVTRWPEGEVGHCGEASVLIDFRQREAERRAMNAADKQRNPSPELLSNPWPVGYGYTEVKPEQATAGDEWAQPGSDEWQYFAGAWVPDDSLRYRRSVAAWPLSTAAMTDVGRKELVTHVVRASVVAGLHISDELVHAQLNWNEASKEWLAKVIVDTFEIRHESIFMPLNWWEAFKERWIPEWLRKRVGMEIRYREFCPRTVLPDFRPMRYGRAINRVGWRVVKRFSRDFGAEGMECDGSHSE